MAQAGNGDGRNNKSVEKIRCVFNENDGHIPKKMPIEPNIVVETSPGKAHYYFLCEDIEKDEFTGIETRLIDDYGSDPNAKDLARVLRLPGFYHNKKRPHLVKISHESGSLPYSRDAIIKAFPPVLNGHKKESGNQQVDVVTDKLIDDLRSALKYLNSDGYDPWIDSGLALKSLGDKGCVLWLEHGSTSDKFSLTEALEKWNTFKPNDITYKSIFHDAYAKGWDGNKKVVETVKIDDSRKWLDGDEMALSSKPPVFLINNILESKSNGLLAGSSGSFKSFFALKIAHSICTGNDFFGNRVFDTGKVLYICGEGINALERRLNALVIVEGSFNGNIKVLNKPLFIDNIAEMDWLKKSIDSIKPVLVIFDTFSSLATSVKENVNEEVARALRMVSDCCYDAGASSIIVHHYGKDTERGSRGASAFSSNVDFEIGMKRIPETYEAIVSCKKSKDGELFKDMQIKAHIVDLGHFKQDGSPSTSLILKSSDCEDILTSKQRLAYDAIRDMVSNSGYEHNKRLCVSIDMLRSLLNDLYINEINKYVSTKRVIETLLKTEFLHCENGHYFL
jgi:hypothetical protein